MELKYDNQNMNQLIEYMYVWAHSQRIIFDLVDDELK